MLFKFKQVKVGLDYIDGMIETLETMPHSMQKAILGWGDINKNYIWIFSDVDATAFHLKFHDAVDIADFGELGPSDDEEVKVHCHRCNGYVFSVSGYEYKNQRNLQRYNCTMKYSADKKQEVCYYEHEDTDLGYSKSAFGNY